MVPEIDIWRTAWLMVKRYGEDASTECAMRADELGNEGDTKGAATWLRIVQAVDEMQRTERFDDETVN